MHALRSGILDGAVMQGGMSDEGDLEKEWKWKGLETVTMTIARANRSSSPPSARYTISFQNLEMTSHLACLLWLVNLRLAGVRLVSIIVIRCPLLEAAESIRAPVRKLQCRPSIQGSS